MYFFNLRRITKKEVIGYQKGIEKKSGEKRLPRPGRPKKLLAEKYQAISIRLHPKVITWAKREAKKRGIGYQTIINEFLLKKVA